MSSSPSPSADCFDVPEHADVLLRFYTNGQEPAAKGERTESEGGDRDDPPAPCRSYHCHASVLSVQSEYLRAQLSSAWQHSSSSVSAPPEAGCRKTVDIHVEAVELDALHTLLQMMYSQDDVLPAASAAAAAAAAAASKPLLLQCLRLADRFIANNPMELLIAELAATPSDDIDFALLSHVFQASPGVCISSSYPAVMESCSKALVELFGDVPTVIEDEDLLQQFCSLPHAAVLAWVQSDELQVHSENCVVFLVSAWVHANQGSTAAQHEELAQHIRVFHLGPAYLHHILPSLGWFKDCSSMEHMPAVLSRISAGIKMRQGLEAVKGKVCSTSSFAFPPGWCTQPRSSSMRPRTCAWVLSPRQLREANSREVLLLPSPVSINGLLITLLVEQRGTDPSAPAPGQTMGPGGPGSPGGQTMGLYVGVDVAAMARHGLPLPDQLLVQRGIIYVKVGSPGSDQQKDVSYTGAGAALSAAAAPMGLKDFLGAAAPTFLELVAPYLDAGQLHIQATLDTIDA